MASSMQQVVGSEAEADACFSLSELQQLLQAEFGAATAATIQWCLVPFEYLARRPGQEQLVVSDVPVSALLPHIPVLVECCAKLIAASPVLEGQITARKALKFMSRVLAVLQLKSLQERLGSNPQLQHCIGMLEASLPSFIAAGQQQQQQPPSSTEVKDTAAGTCELSAPAAAARTAGKPPKGPKHPPSRASRSNPTPQPAAAAAAAPISINGKHPHRSSSKALSLAAVLSLVTPLTTQPNSPFLPDFPQLLTSWARLVYGQLSSVSRIAVAPLMFFHWKTLLQLLGMCLHGAATINEDNRGTPSSSSSSSGSSRRYRPMALSTAVQHMEAILRLLQFTSMQAQFTSGEMRKMRAMFTAVKANLQSMQQPPAAAAAAQDPADAMDALASAAAAAEAAAVPPAAAAVPDPAPAMTALASVAAAVLEAEQPNGSSSGSSTLAGLLESIHSGHRIPTLPVLQDPAAAAAAVSATPQQQQQQLPEALLTALNLRRQAELAHLSTPQHGSARHSMPQHGTAWQWGAFSESHNAAAAAAAAAAAHTLLADLRRQAGRDNLR